ncbi:MAG: di-trans,poly-cis-decaprenylcistransferase [Bacilli bacterium]|nr:di-trans,poly-cis-decaprenylcistransferase [Bacilli bacterium]MBQ4255399.1 di-trans,poly-cis-decaprenylcistransferase [Bacilli bacterium]
MAKVRKEEFKLTKPLRHVAFIMDGNGRWANARGLARHFGHHEACKRIIEIFEVCRKYDIRVMSWYAFSTENWNRPQEEIDHLMDYLEEFFHQQIDYLDSLGTKLIVSGDLSRIRPQTREVCLEAINRTKDNNNYFINICLNYGSRDEIARACRQIAEEVKNGDLDVNDITPDTISSHLYTAGLPEIDLMIRTSGEQRLSNFLLYQNAYSEFVFTPVKWPDFKEKAFIDCLKEYEGRARRFGGLKNE